jgi:competence protein ComEC
MGDGTPNALVGDVDPLVVIGASLLMGGLLPFAPGEVIVGAMAVAWLAVARDVRDARRWWLVLAGAFALWIGGVRAAHAVRLHEERVAAAEVIPRTVRCAGTVHVDSSPVEMRGALRWAGEIRDADCEGVAWSGRVTLYGGPPTLARGDDVDVVAQLAPPTRLWNDGDPRPREARLASERSGGAVSAQIAHRGSGILAFVDRARAEVRGRIETSFPADVAPMSRALVLGESDLSPDDDAAIRASGLAHLLAVSGMHLVIAVVAAVAGLRALFVRIERFAAGRDVGRLAAALGIPLAWLYTELAGDGGSTRRAAWMLTISLAVRVLRRKSTPVRSFGGSLLAMAIGDPLAAFDVSLVLSAAATAGLLLFAAPFARAGERLPGALQPVVRSTAATLAATLPCAPIVACFAPAMPLGGVVANLLAVPVGESIALPLCLLHALLGWWGAAEQGTAFVAAGALRIVRAIARAFALDLLSASVPPPTSWQLVAIGVGLAALLLARPAWRVPVVFACAAFVLLAEVGARRAGRPEGVLRATFLDVGQGDAALVDLPDRSAILIDGGGLVGSPIDIGARVVAPLLRTRRRDALALAVLTHPHPDHFGGLATGLSATRVGALWDSGQGEREEVGGGYALLLSALRAGGVPILRPAAICGSRAMGRVRIDVLAPCPDSSADRAPNDNSIVLRLTLGARAFLFVGDSEQTEERDLLALPPGSLRADVLKVGHHGSRTSSSPAFLAAVSPRVAVVSVGARNRFGHPSAPTLAALDGVGARVWRTDRDGAVTVTTDGASLEVRSARTGVDGTRSSF